MSFHALSRLILHADVSYIIHIACHWSFFSNITSFSYFLVPKPQFFSIFQPPIFAEPVPVELMFTLSTLITGLKHAISPYFGIVWMLFYNIYRFSMKICTKSRNLGLKRRKFQQSRRCFGSRNWETAASHVRMGLCKCVMTPWHHEYLMSSKTGNSANVFRR